MFDLTRTVGFSLALLMVVALVLGIATVSHAQDCDDECSEVHGPEAVEAGDVAEEVVDQAADANYVDRVRSVRETLRRWIAMRVSTSTVPPSTVPPPPSPARDVGPTGWSRVDLEAKPLGLPAVRTAFAVGTGLNAGSVVPIGPDEAICPCCGVLPSRICCGLHGECRYVPDGARAAP